MADFLTRLAGRALGLVPTVQPILAPMYAPGQQFVGAEDVQEMPLFERGAATGYPQAEVRGREISLQNRPADEPAFGGLVGQIMDAREISSPLVSQGASHPQYRRRLLIHPTGRLMGNLQQIIPSRQDEMK